MSDEKVAFTMEFISKEERQLLTDLARAMFELSGKLARTSCGGVVRLLIREETERMMCGVGRWGPRPNA